MSIEPAQTPAGDLPEQSRTGENTLEMPDMYGRLRLLRTYRHVAIVGFSADPYRPSHFVAVYLQAEGYDIVLVNPRYAGQTVLGRPVYASLSAARAAGEQIEIVDVFRKPSDLEPVLREAREIDARVFWLELGILLIWLVLHKTTWLENVGMNHGLSAQQLRRYFWILPALAALGGVFIGWQGGPALFGGE